LQVIKKDSDNSYVQAFQFGSSNQRLMDIDYGYGYLKIIGAGGAVEYTEFTGAVMTWTKSYTYLGDSILSTIAPNGNGGETTEFNHPDRLGTRVLTNQQTGTSSEQASLPFGTALGSETTPNNNTKKFTSYERSARTGLDYAINRTYDSKLARFTQVDPIGMSAVRFGSPQTLNLYTYCGNDAVNHTDPSGLFFGQFFRWLGNLIMKLFRSGVAKKIAVRFIVSFALSGGNFGVSIRSVLPDILGQLGLNSNPLLTPSWNPGLRHPLSLGTSSLSKYIISNLIGGGPKTIAFCLSITDAINSIKGISDQIWNASDYGKPTAREQSGKISFSDYNGGYYATAMQLSPNQSNVTAPKPRWTDGTPRGTYARPQSAYYDVFDIHTHPFDTGQEILITGDHPFSGRIQKVGNVQKPSGMDTRNLDPKLIGLIVTKTSIVVYTQVGRRCTFSR
jgi:RHS repeat-associated protein